MLVKELIERLKECNQEAMVLVEGGGWTYDTVHSVTLSSFANGLMFMMRKRLSMILIQLMH